MGITDLSASPIRICVSWGDGDIPIRIAFEMAYEFKY